MSMKVSILAAPRHTSSAHESACQLERTAAWAQSRWQLKGGQQREVQVAAQLRASHPEDMLAEVQLPPTHKECD